MSLFQFVPRSELPPDSWDERFNDVFKTRTPVEGFAQLLANSGSGRKFTILKKAIESLDRINKEELDDRALTILKAVLYLTINPLQISADEICDLAGYVFTETKHFSTKVLTDTVIHCVDYMKSHEDSDVPTRWIEIFGKVVGILSTRTEIPFEEDELDGREYQTAIINQLCRLTWGSRNSPYLIAAMREFPTLDINEIDSILNTAAQSIKVLEPSAVPPISYQLLKLATERKPGELVHIFDNYFKGMTLDHDEFEISSLHAKRNSLGTVVYHFIHAARHSSALVREIVKRIRYSCDDHTFLMTPFIMSLSLGLTSIDHIKSQIMEILRRSIMNSLKDSHNSNTNAWYRTARGDRTDSVKDCFKSVIDCKSSELDFLFDGLKDIGLVLLNVDDVPSEIYDPATACRELGSFIIESIVKKKHYYFPTVMNELLKTKSTVHIDCLAACLRSLIRTIVQSTMSGRINELIHHLPLMTVETATPIIKSLIPAFQLSRNLLDEMIMVVRKTIWKSAEARKISVQTMVLLLSNSRIVGDIPRSRSQYSESQPIVFTQPSQLHAPNILVATNENECLCYELLSILKRFFSQNSEVRERLYLGLHVVSRKNPELIEVICSHLQTQVKQHMNAQCSEIRMNNLLDFTNSTGMTFAEELGLLIQCLSFVTLRGRKISKNISEDFENQSVTYVDCEVILDAWIDLVSSISLITVEKNASSLLGTSNGHRPTESVRYVRNGLLLQILQTIEALIEYTALRNDVEDDQKMQYLFRKLLEFEPCLAPPPKPTKQDKEKEKKDKASTTRTKTNTKDKSKSKKKANTSTDTASTGTQESQKSSAKTKLKQEQPKEFVLTHILNLESILEIIHLLYTIPGDEDNVLRLVKKQKNFERFVLNVIKQKIDRLKNNESLKERDQKITDVLSTLASIAGALWKVLRSKADDNNTESSMDTDDDDEIQFLETETVSVDVLRFEIILDLVEFLHDHSFLPFIEFLRIFENNEYDEYTVESLFEHFFNTWTVIVNKCTIDGNNEKGLEHLFSILDTMCKSLPFDATVVSQKVLTWCLNYAKIPKDTTIPTVEICGIVVQTILRIGSRLVGQSEKIFVMLAKQCHSVLGDVDPETQIPFDDNFWLITEDTAPIVIITIGLYVERSLGLVTIIIKRLRAQSHYYALETLSDLRDKACVMLTFLINLSTELIRSSFPPGPCIDILQRLLGQVFITTTLLTEHLIEIHSKNKVEFSERKFASLVKLIGRDFKIRVEAFISHIEGIQREEAAEELFKSTVKKGGRVPAAMKQKLVKDAKTIPAMVYQVEKYEQQLILLCQKADVNLLAGTKLSTARDFRIEMNKLKALADTNEKGSNKKKKNKRTRDASPAESSDDGNGNNSSTIQQSGLSRTRNNNYDEDDEEEERPPPRFLKRRR